jgi:predicted metal-dependent hydrolase
MVVSTSRGDGAREGARVPELPPFELRLSPRRKTLEIQVSADGRLIVIAPATASTEQITLRLRARLPWILQQQRAMGGLGSPASPKRYVSGETHRYLGRQFRLRVEAAERSEVAREGRFLRVATRQAATPEQVRRLLSRWYLGEARRIFAERLAEVAPALGRLGIEVPSPLVRTLEKRWGSLSPSGRLLLNVELVKVPLPCIDYVLVHELCHLVEPHHGPSFWRLLERVMPDWRQRRDRLMRTEL